MNKPILFIAMVFCIVLGAKAQVTTAEKQLKTQTKDTLNGWKRGGTAGFSFNQVSLTNWAAGGLNAISASASLKLFANYKKDKLTWDNNLDLGYGLVRQGTGSAATIQKNDDQIDFTSKLGLKAKDNLYYAALLNFKTQFAEGFAYPNDSTAISDFLAPGYLLFAAGVDYKRDKITVFLAPVTSKVTIVAHQPLADAGAFGVTAATYDSLGRRVTSGENIRTEFGGYLRALYQADLMKNVGLVSKLDLFSNYLNNPGNIDVNWETTIVMKVNDYINVKFGTHLIYDDDIDISVDENDDGIIDAVGPRTQFKQLFNLGFSYKF